MNVMSDPQTAVIRPVKLLERMADDYGVAATSLQDTLRKTVFAGATDAEFMALCVTADRYKLNPLMRELYAFPKKGGGIVPVVSVDGWISIVNRERRYRGVRFEWEKDDKGFPISCTAVIRVRNNANADGEDPYYEIAVPEYYEECHRNTDPWNNMPRRMLRHKALMQTARYAFGISGIYDEDEARDIVTSSATTPQAPNFLGGVTQPALMPHAQAPAPMPASEPPRTRRKPQPRQAPPPEAPDDDAPPGAEPPPPASKHAPEPPTPPLAPKPTPKAPTPADAPESPEEPADGIAHSRAAVRSKLASNGISENTFLNWAINNGLAADSSENFDDIPQRTLLTVLANWKKHVVDLISLDSPQ